MQYFLLMYNAYNNLLIQYMMKKYYLADFDKEMEDEKYLLLKDYTLTKGTVKFIERTYLDVILRDNNAINLFETTMGQCNF